MLSSPNTMPRLRLMAAYTPPTADSGHCTSQRYTGSSRRGCAVNTDPWKHRRAVGIIWSSPRCTGSAWITTSLISKRIPRNCSLHKTPCEKGMILFSYQCAKFIVLYNIQCIDMLLYNFKYKTIRVSCTNTERIYCTVE